MSRNVSGWPAWSWVAAAGLVACVAAGALAGGTNHTRGCVEAFDPAADYFPARVAVEDARGFAVTYHRSYKVVRVGETYPGGPAETYVLVQCGTPAPPLTGALAGAQIVSVPITSLYASSATHLPLLVELGRLPLLTGVPRRADLAGDAIVAHARSGAVREFAPVSVIDAELVVSARPGVFMTGGLTSAPHAVIRSAGVPVVANTDWLETTALARAEWLKYVALFLNEEAAAERMYRSMKDRYRVLRDRARAVPESQRPLVMTGRGTRGEFVIAGGRSYVAGLIADAGGRYVWADNTATGTVTIDLERQLAQAAAADVWINGGGWSDLQAMVEEEPRYAAFKSYRAGQVWVYERRQTSTGANDYWSRGIAQPDRVLADLVKIFHPPLQRDHAFEWYMQVPARRGAP